MALQWFKLCRRQSGSFKHITIALFLTLTKTSHNAPKNPVPKLLKTTPGVLLLKRGAFLVRKRVFFVLVTGARAISMSAAANLWLPSQSPHPSSGKGGSGGHENTGATSSSSADRTVVGGRVGSQRVVSSVVGKGQEGEQYTNGGYVCRRGVFGMKVGSLEWKWGPKEGISVRPAPQKSTRCPEAAPADEEAAAHQAVCRGDSGHHIGHGSGAVPRPLAPPERTGHARGPLRGWKWDFGTSAFPPPPPPSPAPGRALKGKVR